jgi:hypothetical protein
VAAAGKEYPLEDDHPQNHLQLIDDGGARKLLDGRHVGRD